jgi:hypothetical protein
MYIKHIWDSDQDYKFYYNQIFSGLHDSIISEERISGELRTFYANNSIDYQGFSKMKKESVKSWGIKERDILDEMERQEFPDPEESETESGDVTLLFAMKWFYSDLTNKGMRSDLVKGLLLSPEETKQENQKSKKKKVKS